MSDQRAPDGRERVTRDVIEWLPHYIVGLSFASALGTEFPHSPAEPAIFRHRVNRLPVDAERVKFSARVDGSLRFFCIVSSSACSGRQPATQRVINVPANRFV